MLPASADRASSVDTGELYERTRQRFITVVRDASPADLERIVEPTPDWRVRDVLAHVVGITADLNALDFGPGNADDWTARQVEIRRRRTIGEITAEWDREAPKFEEGLGLLGYSIGAHYVADLHAHLQDVHMTLGLPAMGDPETVLVALDFYLESLDETLREQPVGALEIVTGGERHVAGSGDVCASLSADPFEVLRALSGRRSLAQVLSLEWTGDARAIAPRLSRYPLPERDLGE